MIEGGFAWLPPLSWRLDSHWKRLKRELPHVKRLPSETIRDHIWLTTQPIEEPHQPEHFLELLEQGNLYDRLMFATDYPHWDFDAPDDILPKIKLPDGFERKLFFETALGFYRLPDLPATATPA
jgi:predicted TIM-barrel fold metal-dependent hydrolase